MKSGHYAISNDENLWLDLLQQVNEAVYNNTAVTILNPHARKIFTC